jgi:ketosteroid isomerase-like protein
VTRIRIMLLMGLISVSSLAPAPGQETGSRTRKMDQAALDKQFAAIDQKWMDAEKNLDIPFIEEFFAPSYLLVLPNGEMYTREKWIGILKSPDHPVFEVLEPRDVHAHVFGDVAILTDTTTVKSHDSQGKESGGTYRVFRVLLKQQGKWRAAGVEMTPPESQ